MTKATSALRKELAGHDEAIERDREQIRLGQVAIEQAQAAKSEAAADLERFAELLDTIRRHEGEVERLGLVVARREQDRAGCAEALAEREFEDAHEAWADRCSRATRRSAEFRRELEDAAKAAAALARARAAADEAQARAEELDLSGGGLEWPADVEEPEWPEIAALLELAAAGPRQPKRRSDEQVAKGDAERARGDEQRIAWTVQRLLQTVNVGETHDLILGAIEEPLRSEARRRYEAEIARERQRRAAASAVRLSRA